MISNKIKYIISNIRYPYKLDLLLLEWKSGPKRPFFPAYRRVTDGSNCCHITPYLDFESGETGNEIERQTYFSGRKKNVSNIPLGVHSGFLVCFLTLSKFSIINFIQFILALSCEKSFLIKR